MKPSSPWATAEARMSRSFGPEHANGLRPTLNRERFREHTKTEVPSFLGIMALLVPCKDDVTVVPPTDLAQSLGCQRVERWPYQYQLDSIEGPSGKRYRFDIWVDEEGALNPAAGCNVRASLAAHPLNEAYGNLIRGPAILKPLSMAVKYTLADWDEIRKGVWSLDCDCDEEQGCPPEGCPQAGLVDRNVRGKRAYGVRIGLFSRVCAK